MELRLHFSKIKLSLTYNGKEAHNNLDFRNRDLAIEGVSKWV